MRVKCRKVAEMWWIVMRAIYNLCLAISIIFCISRYVLFCRMCIRNVRWNLIRVGIQQHCCYYIIKYAKNCLHSAAIELNHNFILIFHSEEFSFVP